MQYSGTPTSPGNPTWSCIPKISTNGTNVLISNTHYKINYMHIQETIYVWVL